MARPHSHPGLDPLLVRAVAERQREYQQPTTDNHRKGCQQGASQLASEVAKRQDDDHTEMCHQTPDRVSAGGTRAALAAG